MGIDEPITILEVQENLKENEGYLFITPGYYLDEYLIFFIDVEGRCRLEFWIILDPPNRSAGIRASLTVDQAGRLNDFDIVPIQFFVFIRNFLIIFLKILQMLQYKIQFAGGTASYTIITFYRVEMNLIDRYDVTLIPFQIHLGI